MTRHEAAEAKGLVSHSFGEGEARYMVIFRPESAPPPEVLAEAETEADIPVLWERFKQLQEELTNRHDETVERTPVRKTKNARLDMAPARGELLVLPSVKKERYSVAETLAEREKKKLKVATENKDADQ